jgi:hypothetical protein
LAATVGFVFVSTLEVAAQGAAVTVLVSNGMKAAMRELVRQCERAIGRPLAHSGSGHEGHQKISFRPN